MTQTVSREQIASTIEGMRDELVELTCSLIRFRTVRLTGEDFEACARFLATHLEKAGFSVDVVRVPDEEVKPLEAADSHYRALGLRGPIAPRYNAIAFRRGSGTGKSLHLNGHYTIVEPGPGWSGDPFIPRIVDGRIIGRGACDMKGGLAMIVGALAALHRLSVPLSGDVYVSATVDTHLCGDLGAGYVVKHGLGRADRVIIADTSGVNRVLTGYRGQLWAEIETRGQTAHGSVPFNGRSAVEDMVHVIRRLAELREELAKTESHADIVPAESKHPTLAIGTQISGGTWLNTVADTCKMTLDRRLIPEETADQAMKQIEQAVEKAKADAPGMNVRVRCIFSAPPAVTPVNDPLVQTLLANIQQVTHRPGMTLVNPGFLDLQWFATGWQVPVVVYSAGDGGAGTGFKIKPYKEPDEWLVIDDLVNATKVLALSILDLGEK